MPFVLLYLSPRLHDGINSDLPGSIDGELERRSLPDPSHFDQGAIGDLERHGPGRGPGLLIALNLCQKLALLLFRTNSLRGNSI